MPPYPSPVRSDRIAHAQRERGAWPVTHADVRKRGAATQHITLAVYNSLSLVISVLTLCMAGCTQLRAWCEEHMRRGVLCTDGNKIFLIGSNEIARPIAKGSIASSHGKSSQQAIFLRVSSSPPRMYRRTRAVLLLLLGGVSSLPDARGASKPGGCQMQYHAWMQADWTGRSETRVRLL